MQGPGFNWKAIRKEGRKEGRGRDGGRGREREEGREGGRLARHGDAQL